MALRTLKTQGVVAIEGEPVGSPGGVLWTAETIRQLGRASPRIVVRGRPDGRLEAVRAPSAQRGAR